MLIAITIELVLQLVLDGDVFLPHMKDVMLQEVFSTVIASILRYACLLLLQCSICAVYSCASVGYFAETGEHEFFSYVNYVQDPEVLKQVLI